MSAWSNFYNGILLPGAGGLYRGREPFPAPPPAVAKQQPAVMAIQQAAPSPPRLPSSAMALTPEKPAAADGEVLRPVSREDSDNGYWDAKNMGNGQGNSYVVRNGVVEYVSDAEMAQIVANGGRRPAATGTSRPVSNTSAQMRGPNLLDLLSGGGKSSTLGMLLAGLNRRPSSPFADALSSSGSSSRSPGSYFSVATGGNSGEGGIEGNGGITGYY